MRWTSFFREVGFEVVGQATDGDTAVDLIAEHRPDAFIAGVDPAVGDQIACVRRARVSGIPS